MNYELNEKLEKFLEDKTFKTEEELQELMKEFNMLNNSGQLDYEPSPMAKAYNYLEKSRNSPTKKQAIENIKKALAVCPECIEASIELAVTNNDWFKKEQIVSKALEQEKKRLTKEGYFKEDCIGHFYGIYETRGYIKALAFIAECYAEGGQIKKAIELCQEVLRLNKDDNTGKRYTLMALYAYCQEEESLKKLYKEYKDDSLETLIPFMVLYYKNADYDKAKKYLDKIDKVNKNFKKYYRGSMSKSTVSIPGCYSFGDSSEVMMYMEGFGFLMDSVPHLDEFVLKNGNI